MENLTNTIENFLNVITLKDAKVRKVKDTYVCDVFLPHQSTKFFENFKNELNTISTIQIQKDGLSYKRGSFSNTELDWRYRFVISNVKGNLTTSNTTINKFSL